MTTKINAKYLKSIQLTNITILYYYYTNSKNIINKSLLIEKHQDNRRNNITETKSEFTPSFKLQKNCYYK